MVLLKGVDDIFKLGFLAIVLAGMLLLVSFSGIFHVREQDSISDPLNSHSIGVSESVPDGITSGEGDDIVTDIRNYEYRVQWDEGISRYVAKNKVHGFDLIFTSSGGVETQVAYDTFSLDPVGFGFAGQIGDLIDDPKIILQDGRIDFCYSDDLIGWYKNTVDGLEHGFDILKPIEPRLNSEVCIELSYGSGFLAEFMGDGIIFSDVIGVSQLKYDKLKVVDVKGCVLPSSMSLCEDKNCIVLSFDDTRAVYPVFVDPLVTSYFKNITNNGPAWNRFGNSVAIYGDTCVVGACADDDGAYVFKRNNQTADDWELIANLSDDDGDNVEYFGESVAIYDDTIVVGARRDTEMGDRAGAAYVFCRNQGGMDNWGQVKKLTASDGETQDEFGYSVAIYDDTIVVGAVKGNGSHNNNSGAAYVYYRNFGGADNWGEKKILSSSDGADIDYFGRYVAISYDKIVVGASGDDDKGSWSGSAYVFYRNYGGIDNWGEKAKLTASDGEAGDYFGFSVAIEDDTIVVGAPMGNGVEDGSGAAYVFYQNNQSADDWGQVAKIYGSDGANGDWFSYPVSISDSVIVAGAGTAHVDGTADQGAAYVYVRNNQSADDWGQLAKLTAFDGEANDYFSSNAISIHNGIILVGAYYHGDNNVGLAYLFNITGDAWTEIAKPVASDGSADDSLGWSVSISGDTIVVGAYEYYNGEGVAYVFTRNNQSADDWGQVAKLTASDSATEDYFGWSVSISGDTIVVGAYRDDDLGSNSGSAYVFSRNQGGADNWGQVTKVTASDGVTGDLFGWSVSISGDTCLVGAKGDDDLGSGSGSAYVFSRNQGGADNWGQVTKLTASDGAANDCFGTSVSVSVDKVVVGALYDDDLGSNSGSAYVFSKNQGGADNWGQVTKLTASDGEASDIFGCSVSVSGDTVVVGAYGADSYLGSAYVFNRNQGGADNWGQVTKLTASNGVAGDNIGSSVSISGETCVVGAYGDDDGGDSSGAAYVFTRNNGSMDGWGQVTKLTATDSAQWLKLGYSVSISDDTVVLGAPGYNPGDGVDQGASYVYYDYSISSSPSLAAPTSLNATANSTSEIYLTWTKASGADKTHIRGKTGSYPTDITDGSLVYNGSASSCSHTSLVEGTRYYYRAWSYNETNNEFSSSNVSNSTVTTNIIQMEFTDPTPVNDTYQWTRYFDVNCSINESDIDTLNYNWNGTNYTMYNDSLVLMYNFDNVSSIGENYNGNDSTIVDLSCYQNNGIWITNETNEETTSIWNTSGRYNGCFGFDGIDDYITTPYSDEVKTLSFWFNAKNMNTSEGLFCQRYDIDEESGNWQMHWDDASPHNKLRIYCYNSGALGRELVSDTTFQTDTWYHVVVTSNPYDVKYYVNGAFDSQHALMDVVLGGGDNDDNLVIGGSFGNTILYPFNGTIDEVRVWDRALNATEVYQQYVSNLQKFNQTQWYLNINQSKNSTTDLDYGSYTYQVFVNDSNDNSNQTMQRTITIFNLSSPTNFTATATSSSVIGLSWIKDSYATRTYICYQQGSSAPTSQIVGTFLYNGTGTSTSATGLSASTSYSFTAWSWNESGLCYSIVNVTTSATTEQTSSSPPPSTPAGPGNTPPIAVASTSSDGMIDVTHFFDGSESSDADGDSLTYTWNYGDGTTGGGKTSAHTYSRAGSFHGYLEVYDGKDHDTDNFVITIVDPYEDTDKDGIDDTLEDELGLDAENKDDVKNISAVLPDSYLIDEDGDGVYDTYYSSRSGVSSSVVPAGDNSYYLDTDNDGIIDYFYDPIAGSVIPYESYIQSSGFSNILLIGVVICIGLVVVFFIFLFWRKRSSEKDDSKKKR